MAATLETTQERSLKRQRYDEATRTLGLLSVIANAGNVKAAHEELATQGVDIPRTTLCEWVKTDRYQELRAEHAPRIQAQIAAQYEDFNATADQTQRAMLERLHQQIADLKPADLASSMRNLGTVQGIYTTQSLALRGQPTSIVEHRNVGEDLQWLSRQGVINATSEPIVDAEEVPAQQATPSDAGSQRA